MNKTVRIKFCAMTNSEDALMAAQLGVDAIGVIFYPTSPRHMTVEKTKALLQVLPPYLTTVGIFVNPTPAEVRAILAVAPLDVLQFQGQESAHFCEQFGRPYIKAIHVNAEVDIMAAFARYSSAQGLLLDNSQPGILGGTGVTFDWSLVPKNPPKPLILAGGLTPANVATAIRQVKPFAVDVVSGIERERGLKDHAKMRAFVEQVRKTEGMLA